MDRWLIGAMIFVFFVYIYGTYTFEVELGYFVEIHLVSALILVTSLAVNLTLYFRHKLRKYAISYLFLSIGMGSYTIAEILWGYLDHIGIYAYPSIADVFYLLYFAGSILFCTKIFYDKKSIIPLYMKGIGVLAGIGCMSLYLVLSVNYLDSEVFAIGTVMMAFSSALLGTAIFTTLYIYRSPHLKKIWLVFGIAFTANSIADIFYYSGENAGQFALTDWTNIVWFGTILMLFYAGYSHRYLYVKP